VKTERFRGLKYSTRKSPPCSICGKPVRPKQIHLHAKCALERIAIKRKKQAQAQAQGGEG
jgi:hypothetical protein